MLRVIEKGDQRHFPLDKGHATYLQELFVLPQIGNRGPATTPEGNSLMEKIREVEAAKALMTEAMGWSVMKWLREKKSVRKAADAANAALDQLNAEVKGCWPEPFRVAYSMFSQGKAQIDPKKAKFREGTSETLLVVGNIWRADGAALEAREVAERTFDDAERQLSTSLAREGCRKAIYSWELHEKAIRKAEGILVTANKRALLEQGPFAVR